MRWVYLIAAASLGSGSLPALATPPRQTFEEAFGDLSISSEPVIEVPDERPSMAAAQVIDWILDSRDNAGRPFIVIDKVDGKLYLFGASGRNYLETPVLVGIAKGDTSSPGVGNRELSQIPVAQRTTPAGRFLAFFGKAVGYKDDVLWVDFASAVSLHPVVTTNKREHRLERLRSPTAKDNRITFGCINVDAAFYKTAIEPEFRQGGGGLVYIIPEAKRLDETFAGFVLNDH